MKPQKITIPKKNSHCSGYNAFQTGSGVHGGSAKQQNKRNRRDIKNDIRKYVN